jgi:hypothetical protein
MPQVISGEVDVFARIEHVDGGRVAQDMNVAPIGWKIGLGCVEAEEILYPPLFQPSLKTREERFFFVFPALE